jgi:hypothetical protein
LINGTALCRTKPLSVFPSPFLFLVMKTGRQGINIMAQDKSKNNRKRPERRKSVVDRRTGLDRRRGPGVRLSEERKAAELGQMSPEQFEFLMAIDDYKRKNDRPFPTWTEVLEVVKALGYRRVAEPQPICEPDQQHEEIEVTH